MINPDFLRTFQKLAETQHFTRAADALSMTQPGVSQHLTALEDYFGGTLVTRKDRQFVLTPKGEKVLSYANDLFARHEQFLLRVTDDDAHSGVCRFASPGSFGIRMYSHLLQLNAKHRNLVIHFAYASNAFIKSQILSGELDMGFISEEPDPLKFDSTQIDQENLCLVVPQSLRKVTFTNLQELGFINHPDGFHHATRLLEANFPDEFLSMEQLNISGFNNQITRIPDPVGRGLGFTALPEFAAKGYHRQDLVKIPRLKRRIVDPIYAIWKKHRFLPARFQFVLNSYRS